MCLALPGKVMKTYFDGNLLMGEVDFSGVQKVVCLAYTPEAKNGDFVVVHVGFAISVLNEDYAKTTLELAQDIANEIRG
jgi:hydrogenase expression/formation protein HypC